MPGVKASEDSRRKQILRAAYEVASRRGLSQLTVRLVAERAALSTGLVLFHFKSKDQLINALLDYVLETTTVLHLTEDIASIPVPLDRLLALLVREMHRLSSEPRRIRLFFDFWALGFTNPTIRGKMQAELDRYREAFRPMAEEVLAAEPERFARVTAEGLAAVAVSVIKGCAVQSMIDPRNFDIDVFLSAAPGAPRTVRVDKLTSISAHSPSMPQTPHRSAQNAPPPVRARTTDSAMEMPSARRLGALFWSLIRLRCPNCSRGKVLAGGFKVRERCSECCFRYERSDENYFQGAMFVNFMLGAGTFAVSLLLVLVLSWPDVPWDALTYGAPLVMLAFMIVLYPFSKVVWLTVDVMVRPVTAAELE